MKIDENVLDQAMKFIAKHEGLRLKPYICPGNARTIGYGHKMHKDNTKVKLTQKEAWELLKTDVSVALLYVLKKTKVPLNANQQVALTSFAFNLGPKAYLASTLRQKLNRKQYLDAAKEFEKWIYAFGKKMPGLIKRRAEEQQLFLSVNLDNYYD